MKLSVIYVPLISFMASMILLGGVTASAQQVQVIQDFEIPLDVDPKTGAERSRLKAQEATLMTGKPVRIKQLTIEYLDKKGNVELTVTSPSCDYDQKNKVAASRDRVRIERKNATITGTGFKYDSGREQFKIYDDVKLVVKNRRESGVDLDGPRAQPPKESP